MNGVVVLDKPSGWTSHDAVNKIRRLAATTKVGHLGTLRRARLREVVVDGELGHLEDRVDAATAAR